MATRTNDRADPEVSQLRVPPHSMEAEQSVLGGLLLDNMAWDRAGDLLTESDFYRYEHKLIYAAITALVVEVKPADVITVFEHLRMLGQADQIGGLAYLNALAQSVPSAANIRRYSEIVRERAILRKLVAAGDAIATQAFNPAGRPVSQILDESETRILAIGEEGGRLKNTWRGMDDIAVRLIDRVSTMAENGSQPVSGVRTGFYDLDRMTTGLQPGDLIILAARPSMGKTSLALNFVEEAALELALPVLIFSMEMSGDQLGLRMAGSAGRIDQQNLRTGALTDREWDKFSQTIDRLGKAPIFIDESPALSPEELRARARRKAREHGKLGLIVVDYLQLMSASEVAGGGKSSAENRATVLGEISRGLKALGKELGCPVVALSQLNRSVESRQDKRPVMSDLRESGALEQDADVIFFIYRDEYYHKEETKEPGVAEIIIAKQRCGPVGTVKLAWQKDYARFESMASS